MAAPNASLEVVPACVRLSSGLVAAIGFTARRRPCLFPCTRARFPRPNFHLEALRGLILRSGPPPQSSFTSWSCFVSFDRSSPTWGFGPHRDITDPRPPFAGPSQALLRSVLRLPRPLDGLLRVSARGLVSSRSHVQGSRPFRGFSPRAACLLLVEGECPPAVSRPSTHQPKAGCRVGSPRLRGFAPREGALSRDLVLPASRPAPLFGFLSPPGANHHLESGYPILSARDVAVQDLRLRVGPIRPPSASHQQWS